MNKKQPFQFTTDVILFPLLFVMLLWLVFWVEMRFDFRFAKYGIYPQKLEGLRGILFGPFIHSGIKHIFNNSVPIFVLSTALFYFYQNIRWKVLLFGTVLTGLLTWSFARPALHIGASGVVYMLAAFLFFKGVFSRRFQLASLSLIVVFLYGSLLWYLFPIDPKISWEGHLSGFIVGILLAVLFRKNPIEKKKYEWEKEDFNPEEDPFLRHFDEDGNFIEHLPEDDPKETATTTSIDDAIVKINYLLRQHQDDEDV